MILKIIINKYNNKFFIILYIKTININELKILIKIKH